MKVFKTKYEQMLVGSYIMTPTMTHTNFTEHIKAAQDHPAGGGDCEGEQHDLHPLKLHHLSKDRGMYLSVPPALG